MWNNSKDMNTKERQADLATDHIYNMGQVSGYIPTNDAVGEAEKCFFAGVEFAQQWYDPSKELPVEFECVLCKVDIFDGEEPFVCTGELHPNGWVFDNENTSLIEHKVLA